MLRVLYGILIAFFLFAADSCYAQYRSKPISISKRRFKQIQARKNIRRERYVPRYARSNVYTVRKPSRPHPRYINANAINRKRNKRMVARKRKMDNNYKEYRDFLEARKSDRSNFSIYDK